MNLTIQNLQLLPDSGQIWFRNQKGGIDPNPTILEIDPALGAINEWTFKTPILNSPGGAVSAADLRFYMDFGQHDISDAAPGGQVLGLMEGRLYKVAN